MPSSTSNSDARLPAGPHGRILVAGVALALSLAALFEGYVRARGFVPSVTDDVQLWSRWRNKVQPDDLSEIVLIGASRMQADLDGDVFAREFSGIKPKQLAIPSSSLIPVLEQLSRDQTFKGLLICDVMGIHFFTGLDRPKGKGLEYVAYSEKDWPWDLAATQFRVMLQTHLTLRAPNVSPSPSTVLGLLGLRPLRRQHTIVDADRYMHLDRRPEEVPLQGLLDLARGTELNTPVSAEQLDLDLTTLDEAVMRIQARGGRVVFAVLPVSGLRREAEERRFPRPLFWDKLVARTHAVTIHFADDPALAGFLCHDESHLRTSDASIFTRSFVSVLKTKLRRVPEFPAGPPARHL